MNRKLFWVSLIFALILAEGLLRGLSSVDENGNVHIQTRRLKPYALPTKEVHRRLRDYRSAKAKSFIVYHSELGWIPRPEFQSKNGYYTHDTNGIRVATTGKTIVVEPKEKVFRIALVGDSYIYGDEVPFEESLGAQLEKSLRKQGYKVEVVNFGTGGYGIDQAVLRTQSQVLTFKPHLVVMGIQPENVARNLNLYRAFYTRKAQNPFFKPRFQLASGELQLLNVPTPAPEEIAELVANFKEWPLSWAEHYFQVKDYQSLGYRHSRILAYAEDVFKENRFNRRTLEQVYFDPQSEGFQLTLALVKHQEELVDNAGSELVLVHLPRKPDLLDQLEGLPLGYEALLLELDQYHELIRPEKALLQAQEEIGLDALFAVNQHYSGTGHHLVVNVLQQALMTHLNAFQKDRKPAE